MFTAECVKASPLKSHAKQRFNGAAVVHRGMLAGRPAHRQQASAASMGPRLFTAECAEEFAVDEQGVTLLQWGRGYSPRNARFLWARITGGPKASMGPRLFTAECSSANSTRRALPRLQWGRGCSPRNAAADTRETACHYVASMGPRLFTAECIVNTGASLTLGTRFNGAAVVHRGMQPIGAIFFATSNMLQWGRGCSPRNACKG